MTDLPSATALTPSQFERLNEWGRNLADACRIANSAALTPSQFERLNEWGHNLADACKIAEEYKASAKSQNLSPRFG